MSDDLLKRLRFEGDNSDHHNSARLLFHEAADELENWRKGVELAPAPNALRLTIDGRAFQWNGDIWVKIDG